MKRRLLALVMLPILLNTSGGRAFAALSEQKVVNTLSKLKPFANGRKMNVQTSGEQVSISLVRAKGATDKDLKIEALMAAKSLLDVEPSVLAVTMRFFDDRQPRHYVEVYVTSAEVKAFGSGMVSSDDLLTSLRTTEGAPHHRLPQAALLPHHRLASAPLWRWCPDRFSMSAPT